MCYCIFLVQYQNKEIIKDPLWVKNNLKLWFSIFCCLCIVVTLSLRYISITFATVTFPPFCSSTFSDLIPPTILCISELSSNSQNSNIHVKLFSFVMCFSNVSSSYWSSKRIFLTPLPNSCLIRRVVLFKVLKEFLHCVSFSSLHFHLLSAAALYSTRHFLDQQLRTGTRCIFLLPFFLSSKIELHVLLSLSQVFYLFYPSLKFRVNTTLLSVSLVVYSLYHIMLSIIHSKVTYC